MTGDMPEDRDIAAAEYVLGIVRGPDRVEFERRMATDTALRDAVAAWEDRLSAIAASVPPMEPPETLWPRVEASIRERSRPVAVDRDTTIDTLLGRLRFWRFAAIASAGAAVALAVFLAVTSPFISGDGGARGTLTAVLESPDRPSAWVVSATADSRQFSITGLREPRAETGRDFELWVVQRPGTAPVSLGVIGRSNPTYLDLPPARRQIVAPGVTLAISIEPAGGSPTGAPTGPVVFTGGLVRAP